MQLRAQVNISLPKLAWVAEVDRTSGIVTLLHGPLVEVRENFFIEGVWNGPFQLGEFGTTDCVFGSGGILTGDSIRFVPSAATVDYLYYADKREQVTVSNSLPLLLASIRDALDPCCQDYSRICDSIIKGIYDYRRSIPTKQGQVRRVMYWNLDVSREAVSEVDKTMPPRFSCFKEYRNYLRDNYALIAHNARDPARTQPLEIWSTQSKGYDTTAVNAICRPDGIDNVSTISQAKSRSHLGHNDAGVTHDDDDGGEICALLGLPCIRLDRRAFVQEWDDESLYYCTLHHCQDANLKDLKKHMQAPSLLLTGINGDVVWPREYAAKKTVIDSAIRRGDLGGHGLSELRLAVGFIHLPLAFMGARRKVEIVAISESDEMQPWRLNNAYDRPIPRRIAEEAGVPRQLFGQSKMASVVIFPKPSIPHGRALRREFFDYLADEKIMARYKSWFWPVVRWVNTMLTVRSGRIFQMVYYAERVISKLSGREFRFKRLWSNLDGALFCFCVNRTAKNYFEYLSRWKTPSYEPVSRYRENVKEDASFSGPVNAESHWPVARRSSGKEATSPYG
jgi:hypothetical protein